VGLASALAILVTLVAVDAVVDITRNVVVMEVVGVIAAMASSALENGVVVGVDMARRTHPTGVAMARRELRVLRMIEGRAGPCRCVVAVLAGSGEELRLCSVTGVRGVVVVGLVTSDACCRQCCVVVVHVAVTANTRRHGMRAGKGEGGVVVVEGRVGPDSGVVTQLASRRESRGCVCGISGAVVIILVTRIAESAGQVVIIVDVAICALPGRYRVGARQRESGAVVVEGGVQPRTRVVALVAPLREVRCYVIGIGRSLIVLQVARHTSCTG